MKAWQVRELGEPRHVLALAEVPDPEPSRARSTQAGRHHDAGTSMSFPGGWRDWRGACGW
jgi:hypothetical protein